MRRSGPIPPLPQRGAPPIERPGRRPVRAGRPPAGPGRRRLLRVGTALALVLGVVVLYHLALYFYIDQKIGRVQALTTDGAEILAPQLQAGAQNYLVVGTGVPARTGPSSVTTQIVSVFAAGKRAVLVSVPPTAMVDTPLCRTLGGALREPVTEEFASSLLHGGPACMVRAVQQLSGLRIDHYLGVDLAKLPGMVAALGGVPFCTLPSASAAAAAVPPPPGLSTLSGPAAAGFLRPGTADPDPTGAAVTERSQRLLTATLRSALTVGSLADPVRLARFLNRAADALTVDDQTNLGDLRALAGSLGTLSGTAVQRAELPVAKVGYLPAGTHRPYSVLDVPATRALFDAVIGGTRLPAASPGAPDTAPSSSAAHGAATAPAAKGSAAPPAAEPTPPAAPLGTTPGVVTVDVLNGTGRAGLAGKVADALRGRGFVVGTVGNSGRTVASSTVRYGPGAADKARVLAAAVPGAVLQASSTIGNAVQLVIGPNYSTVLPVPPVAAPPAAAVPSTPAATQPVPQPTPATPVSC